MDLSLFSQEEIVNELQKRHPIFICAGNKILNAEKFEYQGFGQCGKDLLGSLELIDICKNILDKWIQNEINIPYNPK